MLRDASRRAWAVEAPALATGRDAPQHEGEGAPRVLAKRTQRRFGQTKPRIIWPSVVPARGTPRRSRRGDPVAGTHDHRRWLWVPALPSLSRGSAGTTIAWSARRINLRLCEMTAGAISLFPIDINNGNCNSNVFGLRGPYHPHMSPTMWHHPS